MSTRTGKVILAKGIKLDKQYKNILDYSESAMVTLCQNKAVASFTNCSFIRATNPAIDVEIPYGTALQANYIAFQDPDYSNKWFFGFIDDVEYKSERTQRIHFTIDYCSTWYEYWNPRQCFVVREHTNDDTVGSNTLSENVELGEFIFNGQATNFGATDVDDGYIALGVSELIEPFRSNNPLTNWLTVYGGIFSGLQYMFFDSFVSLQRVIDYYVYSQGKKDAILTMFYVPYEFVSNSDPKRHTYTLITSTNTAEVVWLEPSDSPISTYQTITKPSQLSGYTPKNNKLLTYPYCFFNLTNNAGTECEYRYEDFNGNPRFDVTMTLCPSMSIKATAHNYKTGGTDQTWGEGIMGAKTPQCSWVTDYYTNWLTQNGINQGVATLSTGENVLQSTPNIGALVGAIGTGITTAINPVAGMISLAGSVGNIITETIKASKVPDQVSGNMNAGDVNFSNNKCCFTILPKCIKPEYARIIDDYFTMFGYKTARLKMPNQTGRQYWNYVQIAEGESIGYTIDTANKPCVPSQAMDIINSAYQRGVTVWHNHDNIGNYTLNNVII